MGEIMYLLRATDDQIGKLVYLSGFLAGAGVDTSALAEILDTAMEFDPESESLAKIGPDTNGELVEVDFGLNHPLLDSQEWDDIPTDENALEDEPAGGDIPTIDAG